MYVTDIATLKARQDAEDAKTISDAKTIADAHGEVLVREPLKLSTATVTADDCGSCGGPIFLVGVVNNAGRVEARCQCCINATASLSLVHTGLTRSICLNCHSTPGRDGIITGANHQEMMIEDRKRTNSDGSVTVFPGLKTRIAGGLVEIDDGTDIVLIHDVVHSESQHCRGCERVRHPGCERDAVDAATGLRVCPDVRE